ncbi:MAG: hypothetical protein LBS67_05725, partial [Clostridiales Family XIII bacterium]|nr:hypothetical protein [Clostridiales Family XIII bacterium]
GGLDADGAGGSLTDGSTDPLAESADGEPFRPRYVVYGEKSLRLPAEHAGCVVRVRVIDVFGNVVMRDAATPGEAEVI